MNRFCVIFSSVLIILASSCGGKEETPSPVVPVQGTSDNPYGYKYEYRLKGIIAQPGTWESGEELLVMDAKWNVAGKALLSGSPERESSFILYSDLPDGSTVSLVRAQANLPAVQVYDDAAVQRLSDYAYGVSGDVTLTAGAAATFSMSHSFALVAVNFSTEGDIAFPVKEITLDGGQEQLSHGSSSVCARFETEFIPGREVSSVRFLCLPSNLEGKRMKLTLKGSEGEISAETDGVNLSFKSENALSVSLVSSEGKLIPADRSKPEFTTTSVAYKKTAETASYSRAAATPVDGMNWMPKYIVNTLDRWGGYEDVAPDQIVSTNPAGFWRTGKYNGRWVMVNPDGNVTILHGINGVAPNSLKEARSDRGEEEYRKRFSNIGEWAGETDRILSDTGFDFYSVNLSRLNMYSTYYPEVQPVMRGEQGESRRGQVEIAFLLRTFKNDYGALTGVNFSESDASIFTLLFDPGYLDYIDNLAEQATAPFRGDRAFIGYYTDNELQFRWASSSTPAIYLKHWIALDTSDGKPRAYAYARQYAENFMREKYGKEPLASNITSAMEEAFLLDVSSYYYKTVSETLRRHDPDHLILGSRLHGMPITLQTIHKACAEYCDVVSLNIYSVWEPDDSFFINQFKVWVPAKPCIVTEFYTRDAETSYGGEKYANTGEGGGWIVASQASRGLYYQNFTRKLISYDHCVGWQWFQFSDDYRVGYGWNNKGIVNPAYEPYVDCTSLMQQLHWNIYQIMDYYHSPTGNRESGGTLAMEILR